jgi:hypothetical protein
MHQMRINYKKATMIGHVLVILLLAFLALSQVQSLWSLRQRPDVRITIYRAVGEWLEANTQLNASIGSLEVGIIGFYAQRYMVDFAGLIQPDVALQLKRNTTYEDAALWAVGQYHPDYLILHDGIFPRLEDGYISKHCLLVGTFEGLSYNYSRNISIYNCEQ